MQKLKPTVIELQTYYLFRDFEYISNASLTERSTSLSNYYTVENKELQIIQITTLDIQLIVNIISSEALVLSAKSTMKYYLFGSFPYAFEFLISLYGAVIHKIVTFMIVFRFGILLLQSLIENLYWFA